MRLVLTLIIMVTLENYQKVFLGNEVELVFFFKSTPLSHFCIIKHFEMIRIKIMSRQVHCLKPLPFSDPMFGTFKGY